MTKVAVAMSGGVDSSVAAALAVEKYGCENVFGLTMKLFCYAEGPERESKENLSDKSCCSLDAINDAAAVCKQLGIAHYVVNLKKEFEKEIINDFISEYEQGRTPNPCVRCNSLIKFGHLLTKAQELGADLLVTGHYARILPSPLSSPASQIKFNSVDRGSHLAVAARDPRFRKDDSLVYHLLRGVDTAKDQSYFLYNLDQAQLAHVWFPLGELTKPDTRKLAKKYGLKTAKKTESQDICFVSTTTQDFLTSRIKAKPGNIVDTTGKVLGRHEGLPFYTIGQRKGLGGGFTEPMYVIGLDLAKNELVVGREEELYDDEMIVGNVSWTGETPALPAEFDVKIRYNSESVPATLSSPTSQIEYNSVDRGSSLALAARDSRLRGNDVLVKFHAPQKAITPGQTAVFYSNDEVIGGGVIL